jgi:RNA polymerase sigma-32 factor
MPQAQSPRHEQDHELVRRIQQTQDGAAARALLASQRRLVLRVAYETGGGLPVRELISEGNLGVLEAVHYFDRDRGGRFAALAEKRVRTRIARYAAGRTRDAR